MKKLILLLFFSPACAFAQEARVKFAARIQNRHSDTLTLEQVRTEGDQLKIFRAGMVSDEGGNFEGAFTMLPGLYQLLDGVESATVYLEDGYDLNMEMDAKMFDETILFTGRGSGENNYLAKKFLLIEEAEEKIAESNDKTNLTRITSYVMNKLRTDLTNEGFSRNFRKVMDSQLIMEKSRLEKIINQTVAFRDIKGKPSPEFDCENHKGGTTSLEDLKGKYVYIDVWTTWCGPCLQEIPNLQKLVQAYRGKNIEFVSLSIDAKKDHDKWKKMVTDRSLGGIQLFSGKGFESSFVRRYSIESIPRFILIDPSGNIVDAEAKRPGDPALREQLDKLLY
ncbi:TlpA disulfide reductase family protein [Flavobacterium sp. DGU11]|uniref:TlpA disulfide reductase family protein n=1 Tax=Flavobacterium arundinis TaxID=3139143 RepID=A0ABU9I2P6_9FLAO